MSFGLFSFFRISWKAQLAIWGGREANTAAPEMCCLAEHSQHVYFALLAMQFSY